MLRRLRILVLLMVLVAVATGTWLDRIQSTDWDGPLLVALYPVNADGSAAAAAEIRAPRTANPELLADFFAGEAAEHGVKLSAAGFGCAAAEVDTKRGSVTRGRS